MKKYKNTIEFEVYGNYALFADPVTRVGGEKAELKLFHALHAGEQRLILSTLPEELKSWQQDMTLI